MWNSWPYLYHILVLIIPFINDDQLMVSSMYQTALICLRQMAAMHCGHVIRSNSSSKTRRRAGHVGGLDTSLCSWCSLMLGTSKWKVYSILSGYELFFS